MKSEPQRRPNRQSQQTGSDRQTALLVSLFSLATAVVTGIFNLAVAWLSHPH